LKGILASPLKRRVSKREVAFKTEADDVDINKSIGSTAAGREGVKNKDIFFLLHSPPSLRVDVCYAFYHIEQRVYSYPKTNRPVRYGWKGERDTRGDSNWVPAEAIESIEVLRGPAAVPHSYHDTWYWFLYR